MTTIIAFILIKIIPMRIEIALGVMVIAAAPGGVTSNILTKLKTIMLNTICFCFRISTL